MDFKVVPEKYEVVFSYEEMLKWVVNYVNEAYPGYVVTDVSLPKKGEGRGMAQTGKITLENKKRGYG